MSASLASLKDCLFKPSCCLSKSGEILAKKPWFETVSDDPFYVTDAALKYLNAAQTDKNVSLQSIKCLAERARVLSQDFFHSDLERARFSAIASQASLLFWTLHPKSTATAKQLYKEAMQANMDKFHAEFADSAARLQKAQEVLSQDPMKGENVRACVDAMIRAGATKKEIDAFVEAVFTNAFRAFCTKLQIDELSEHRDSFSYPLKCMDDLCEDSRELFRADLFERFDSSTKLICYLRSLSDLATEYTPNAPRVLLLRALFLEAYNFVYKSSTGNYKTLNAFKVAANRGETLASTFALAKAKQRMIDPAPFNSYCMPYDALVMRILNATCREDINPVNIDRVLIEWSLDRYNPEYYAESGRKADLFRWLSAPYFEG